MGDKVELESEGKIIANSLKYRTTLKSLSIERQSKTLNKIMYYKNQSIIYFPVCVRIRSVVCPISVQKDSRSYFYDTR